MIWLLVSVLAECGGCHPKQDAEWRGSRHQVASSNAIFAASFAREPARWCLGCHAPQAPATASRLSGDGVGCASCHLQKGRWLSRRELASPELCGTCHQFDFPRQPHQPMQDTLAEWRRSGSSQTCQDCHMPSGAHTFPGAHDLAFLRRAVDIAVLPAAGGVEIRLSSKAAHRVPTGDPFRRLFVELCDDVACAEPFASPAFGRSFVAAGEGWKLARDTSIVGEARRTVATPGGLVYWRLRYGFAAPSSRAALSDDDWAVSLASGVVRRR
jgi:hypothetical protein